MFYITRSYDEQDSLPKDFNQCVEHRKLYDDKLNIIFDYVINTDM